MRDAWRTLRTSIASIVISAGLLTSWLALPQTVAACSCYSGDLAGWARSPDVVIFSGTVQVNDPQHPEVAVDRWFHGPGMAPVVRLDPADFGTHGESCQVAPPPPGSRWLFAAGRRPGTDLVSISLCSVRGDLATDVGRALLAEAVKTFPNAVAPPPATVEPSPPVPVAVPSSAPPAAPDSSEPWATIGGVAPFLAVGVSGLVVAGLVVAAVAVARRRRAHGA